MEVFRGIEPIYSLQADGYPPSFRPFFLGGFSLADIMIEIQILLFIFLLAHSAKHDLSCQTPTVQLQI